jgi:hypothetical protein
MFVLCVLYSKDKRHSEANQNKEVVQLSTENKTTFPVEARFPAPIQTGPGTHPASYTVGTESLSWE